MASPERLPRAWLLLRLGSRRHPNLGVLSVWTAVERWTNVKAGVRPVRPGGLLRFSLTVHRGPDAVELRDGTVILPGDPLVELHLANRRLGELAGQVSPWRLVEMLRADLRVLAAQSEAGGLGPAVALHGTTLLAAAGRRLGFELREPGRTPWPRLHRFFFAGLVALHNPAGWEAARRKGSRWPGELWLSRRELERLYGAAEPATGSRARRSRPSEIAASPRPTSAISTSLAAR